VKAEEKLAITEAIDAYLALADEPELAGLAALFTDDATWEMYAHGADRPYLRFTSLSALGEALAAAPAGPRRRHHRTGLRFDAFEGSTARTTVKVLVTVQDADGDAPRVENVARETGSWRRTELGWKISAWKIFREITVGKV
jgi:SnoaL-like domain